MLHQKIKLNETAYIEMYVPDSIISYGVYRKWPAAVICPGGGYMISAIKEGEAVAMQFLAKGYACFVLRYSTFMKNREAYQNEMREINNNAYYPQQILELMETLAMIHEHAEEYSIDPTAIFTLGFSAGAHIVAMEALRWNDETLIKELNFIPQKSSLKPKGSILCYPMLNTRINALPELELSNFQQNMMNECLHLSTNPSDAQIEALNVEHYIQPDMPDFFIWHTAEDSVTNSEDTTAFVQKLQKNGSACEYHLFNRGKHGLACGNEQYASKEDDVNSTVEMWLPLVFNWMGEL